MCILCRPCVDVHKGGGGPAHVDACGQGGQKRDFCGRHKWMASKSKLVYTVWLIMSLFKGFWVKPPNESMPVVKRTPLKNID